MANLTTLVATMRAAKQGENVRDAIADTLEAVNVDNIAIIQKQSQHDTKFTELTQGEANALASADAAADSEVIATTKAGIATTQAGISTTKAEEAAASKLAAETARAAAELAEAYAEDSKIDSKASELAAEASKVAAAGSAGVATTKAGESAVSAADALAAKNLAEAAKTQTQAYKDATLAAVGGATNLAEIIESRKGKATLGEKIGEIDSQLAEKASQVAVDAKFGSMGNTKTFKGSCTNAVLTAKTGMAVDDYWYVSDLTTNKCWNGTAWVDIGNVLKIGDGTVTPLNTSFMAIGDNKFDLSAVTVGKFYDGSGNLLTASSPYYNLSDWMLADKDYVVIMSKYASYSAWSMGINAVCFFDASKVFISRITATTVAIAKPANAVYFRFYYDSAHWFDIMAITNNDGITPTEYKLFAYQVKSDIVLPQVATHNAANTSHADIRALINNINPNAITDVFSWGDSLSEGTGGAGTTYPSVLQSLLTSGGNVLTVNNCGIGGESSQQIATRQGALPFFASPFTIPASGGVTVTLTDYRGSSISLLRDGGMFVDANFANLKINPCTIAGVEGVLSRPDAGVNSYVFTRSVAGSEIVLIRPTCIHTYADNNCNNGIAVIWVGTNDTTLTVDEIINFQRYMVDKLKYQKYIIVGLTSLSYHPDIVGKNYAMLMEFGRHFLDIRTYLLNYGLSDASITPTTNDTNAITSGEMPPSLISQTDGLNVHFNASGYTVIGTQIYKKGKDLGYWN